MKLAGLLVLLFLSLTGRAGEDRAVSGQYMEDRSSRVFGCPCEQSSEWANEGREAVLAWKIASGTFNGEDLGGLRLVAVLLGQFTLSEATTSRRSVLYADAGAREAQRKAGVDWLRSRFGDTIGRVEAVHAAAIQLNFAAESVSLVVPDTLDIRMRRADFDRDTRTWASLIYDPFVKLESADFGTTLRTRYAGPELAIMWQREDTVLAITGYFGRFTVR